MFSRSQDEMLVGIAEYKVARAPGKIVTLGLGSCVGISLYDSQGKVGGLLHVMLPDSNQFKQTANPLKFPDTGIPLMMSEMKKIYPYSRILCAKLVGGAQMFTGFDKKYIMDIGLRNVQMTRTILSNLGIRVLAEDVGGNKGRSMILDTETGSITIRTANNVKVI